MKNILLSVTLLGLAQITWAGEAEVNHTVPVSMYQFRVSLMELAPYMGDKSLFSLPQNRPLIQSQLREMANLTHDLKSHERLQSEGFNPPAELVKKQIRAAYAQYLNGNYAFSWRVFTSAIHGCSTCHTQMPRSQAPIWNFDGFKTNIPYHQEANFYYTIRDYKKAQDMYQREIFLQPLLTTSPQDFHQAIKRTLVILLRIEQSPIKAITFLNKLEKESSFSTHIKGEIKEWKDELRHLIRSRSNLPTMTATTTSMEKFSDELLREVYPFPIVGRSRELTAIYVSGKILNFLNQFPNKASPDLLYWLGMVMDDTDDDSFSHTGDDYLKRCIEKFPHSPRTDKCFQNLKQKWFTEFAVVSEVSLPEEIQQELKYLEALSKPTK